MKLKYIFLGLFCLYFFLFKYKRIGKKRENIILCFKNVRLQAMRPGKCITSLLYSHDENQISVRGIYVTQYIILFNMACFAATETRYI